MNANKLKTQKTIKTNLTPPRAWRRIVCFACLNITIVEQESETELWEAARWENKSDGKKHRSVLASYLSRERERERENEQRAVGEKGREEARAGKGGEAKARGGHWGGSVVVAPSQKEASEAANC